jgi:hypothetical protein
MNAAMHSRRRERVKGCPCDYVGNTSGVPRIAADLTHRPRGSLGPYRLRDSGGLSARALARVEIKSLADAWPGAAKSTSTSIWPISS